MFDDELGVEDEVADVVHGAADVELVGHQRVPVVEVVELHVDAVLVLERLAEQHLGLEHQLEVVVTQMLHIVHNH